MNVRAEVHIELAQKALLAEGGVISGAPGLESDNFVHRLDTCAQLLLYAVQTARRDEMGSWLLVSMVYCKLQAMENPARNESREHLPWSKSPVLDMLTHAMGLEFAERETAWAIVTGAAALVTAMCNQLGKLQRGKP